MVQRTQLINKLRELGFTYRRQADRVDLWRRGSDQKVASVPRRDEIADDHVRNTLRQANCTDAEINAFIQACG